MKSKQKKDAASRIKEVSWLPKPLTAKVTQKQLDIKTQPEKPVPRKISVVQNNSMKTRQAMYLNSSCHSLFPEIPNTEFLGIKARRQCYSKLLHKVSQRNNTRDVRAISGQGLY